MMLNCGAVLLPWRPMKMKTLCICSSSPSATAHQLRQQLDNLHKEADNTRAKANNARLRLMRLSEAVEKLRRQAAVSVQTGKENDARELLFQKKKVMQTMEKLKSRIELFDELSTKLNEAISMKESMLIGNMALDLEVSETEAPTPIRIISPVNESQDNTDADLPMDLNNLESGEGQQLPAFSKSQITSHADDESNSHDEFFSKKSLTCADNIQGLMSEVSTYDNFMDDLDRQLSQIQAELETFLRFSSILLENKGTAEYSKVQHVTEILAGVCSLRERIATIKDTNEF